MGISAVFEEEFEEKEAAIAIIDVDLIDCEI